MSPGELEVMLICYKQLETLPAAGRSRALRWLASALSTRPVPPPSEYELTVNAGPVAPPAGSSATPEGTGK